MKPRSVRDPPVTLTRICSVDTVPFPKLEWSLLAQALSLTVPEAWMSLLLDATAFWGGLFDPALGPVFLAMVVADYAGVYRQVQRD